MLRDSVELNIITNGTCFSKSDTKKLVTEGWFSLSISLHGASASTVDFLRGRKRSFKKTIDNVKLFQRWKDKLKSKKPKLTFQMVLNKYNYDRVLEFYTLAESLGVSIVHLRLINGSGEVTLSLNKEEGRKVKNQVNKIKRRDLEGGPVLESDFPVDEIDSFLGEKYRNEGEKGDFSGTIESRIKCSEPFTKLVILSDGTVHPAALWPKQNIMIRILIGALLMTSVIKA